jgi:diacylglycerol kinase (ATP)
MSGIGIIANPYSKSNKRDPGRSDLLGYILGQQGQLAVTRSIPHLYEVARSFKNSNIEVLAINGGDGTISQTLTAFHHVYRDEPLPRIYLLKGGTMNVLANNLGMRGSPERLLYQLVESFSAGRSPLSIKVPSLLVDDLVGFLFADGLACRFLEGFYQNKSNAFGAFMYTVRVAFSALFQSALSRQILLDQSIILTPDSGPPINCKSGAIMASTIRRLPFGIPFFHRVKKQSDAFEFMYLTKPASRLLRHLVPLILERRAGYTPTRYSQLAKSLAIDYGGPATFSLDGELVRLESSIVQIQRGPAVEFLLPGKFLP